MSSPTPQRGADAPDGLNQDYDAAEKGLYDASQITLAMPPEAQRSEKSLVSEEMISATSSVHKGIGPYPSVLVSSVTSAVDIVPSAPVPARQKSAKKPNKWVLFFLWFNTYRKFFIFITSLNLVGIILAGVGRFRYAENHLGALVLGNLLLAVMMRNELLLRILYTIAIYGLRSVCC